MVASQGRVLLAYSGGLDTSCILAWLIEQGYEVVAFMADVGQEEDFNAAEAKALKVGATKFVLKDLKREFVTELITPAVQANCIYEGVYLLGTSLARPVIARGMIEAATTEQCANRLEYCTVACLHQLSFVSHGCTGKGNDQVRFELAFYALVPSIKVIAPWRLPEFYNRFAGRSDLLKYAEEKGIPVFKQPPSPGRRMRTCTISPSADGPQCIDLTFTRGVTSELIVYKPSTEQREVLGKATDVLDIFLQLNSLARAHGIGRIDIVENRFIGVKSRGCYETPAELSKILYNGYWFSPEREFVQSALEASQKNVNGRVRLSLYKGNVIVDGRASNEGLYDARESSMDEMGGFEPTDTSGFIQIESIRLRKWGAQREAQGKELLLIKFTLKIELI
ncbi:hypothetical protein PSTT_12353 [Puccinia striiformis]|uniref:argininosuccinate synthase n=1 Tax=Puccinia striiformis TaxID=27350 RepID=A0A2S4UWR3_9BASI|nr:hypothetical protein PSTT_12353 [Puccinia striiformis]